MKEFSLTDSEFQSFGTVLTATEKLLSEFQIVFFLNMDHTTL